MKDDLGRRIFEYRKEKKLSQEEFAHIIGVSFVTLNRWENNQNKPRGLQKKVLERILNRDLPKVSRKQNVTIKLLKDSADGQT